MLQQLALVISLNPPVVGESLVTLGTPGTIVRHPPSNSPDLALCLMSFISNFDMDRC